MLMETKCKKCGEGKGFYRMNGALWCNLCGHKKTAAKQADHSAYEQGMARFFERGQK